MIKQIPGETLRLYMAQELGNFIGIPDISQVLAMIDRESTEQVNYQAPKLKPTTMRILIALLVQNRTFRSLFPIRGSPIFKCRGFLYFRNWLMFAVLPRNVDWAVARALS